MSDETMVDDISIDITQIVLDEVDQVLDEFETLAEAFGLDANVKAHGNYSVGRRHSAEDLRAKVNEIRARRQTVDLDAQPTNVKMGDIITVGGVSYMVNELNPEVGIPDVAVLVLQQIPEEADDDKGTDDTAAL